MDDKLKLTTLVLTRFQISETSQTSQTYETSETFDSPLFPKRKVIPQPDADPGIAVTLFG